MDARKTAAAVSAVGMMLVAGCGGGRGGGGSSLPAVPGQLSHGAQPPNTSRISMAFTTGARLSSWNAPARTLRTSHKRRPASKNGSRNATAATNGFRDATAAKRKPQYISPGLVGGSIYISIYQGTSLALTDGPFTVGDVPGYDFYCSFNYTTYQFSCSNYSPVFAPYGNDTFFVTMYDSQRHVLAVTPGMPGTNFYGTAPSAYTITSSGYAAPITINTSAMAASVAIDAPTSCVDPSFTGLYVSVDFLDGAGFPLFGPIANPVTLTTNGSFGINAFQMVSPYGVVTADTFTVYDTSQYAAELFAAADGAQGGVSVSSQGANIGINRTNVASMNLFAVDRLALSPSTGGVTVLGLVDSPPGAYTCGTLPLATYDTATPVTFSNPVAIGKDDFAPGAAVIDNVSGTTFVDAIDLFRASFGFGFYTYTFENALPVVRGSIPGANPLDVTVSPIYPFGNGKIYVLNGDGSIVSVDTSTATIATVASAGSISGPAGIDVLFNQASLTGDELFASSSNTSGVYEIYTANSTPTVNFVNFNSIFPVNLAVPFDGNLTTSAVLANNVDGSGGLFYAGNDPTALITPNVLISGCYPFTSCSLNATYVGSTAIPAGALGLVLNSGLYYVAVPNGATVLTFDGSVDSSLTAGTTMGTFGSAVTRIATTYDATWNAIGYGGAFVFNYALATTVYAPSLTGTRAVIVSP